MYRFTVFFLFLLFSNLSFANRPQVYVPFLGPSKKKALLYVYREDHTSRYPPQWLGRQRRKGQRASHTVPTPTSQTQLKCRAEKVHRLRNAPPFENSTKETTWPSLIAKLSADGKHYHHYNPDRKSMFTKESGDCLHSFCKLFTDAQHLLEIRIALKKQERDPIVLKDHQQETLETVPDNIYEARLSSVI